MKATTTNTVRIGVIGVGRIGRMHAGQHLDERGLAGAVLAHHRMHFASFDHERNAFLNFRADREFECDPRDDAGIAVSERLDRDGQFLRLDLRFGGKSGRGDE